MDKKTMIKLFSEAFLRSFVVLIGIGIIGFGVYFILGRDSGTKQETSIATTEDSTYNEKDLAEESDQENSGEAENASSEEMTTEEMTTEEFTTEEITTEEITTEEITTEAISSSEKKILVLNSTKVSGLAKAWMNKLQGDGFQNMTTGNYSVSGQAQTVIYVPEEGMGQDLIGYFTDAQIEVGSINSGIDVSTDGVDIFIVIGSNDTSVQ